MMLDKNMLIGERYRVGELLGSGGMSEVYKALDETKNLTVALKVLKKEFSENAEFLRRFNTEAQAVKKLTHHGTVQQHDVGSDGDFHYIVLEYVEGKTLKEIINESGPIERKTVIRYSVQICETLNNAHQKSIIHRDVKAQNIMIDQNDRVKVMDFGIARFVDSDTVTFVGENVLGSVHYISPEQARGEAVDASSDIYSLGILLYEMLTGELPFEGESNVAIVLKQLEQDVPDISKLYKDVGRALSDIVIKATQKDKKRRFSSLLDMRKSLLRAEKEPEGTFIKIKSVKSEKTSFLGANKKAGKIFSIAVISIFLFGVIVTTGLIISTRNKNINSEMQEVYVPQLLGKSLEDATKKCEEAGFSIVLRGEIPSSVFVHGEVARQDPESGMKAKDGDTISIYISSGQTQVELPDMSNLFLAEAEEIMYSLGLVGEIEFETSKMEEGMVLNQSPEPGTPVESGDRVTLWVSGEIETGQVMPSTIGLRSKEAYDTLQGVGFQNIVLSFIDDDGSASGIVKDQTPHAGEIVRTSSTVKLSMIQPRNLNYYFDYVANITVNEDKSVVKLASIQVIDDMYVETIWIEERFSKGVHSLPMVIAAEQGGEHVVMITLNGNLIKQETIELRSAE